MWTARQSLTRVAPAPVHRLRHLSAGTKAPASPGAPAAPEFGQKHAGDDTSAGQVRGGVHDNTTRAVSTRKTVMSLVPR